MNVIKSASLRSTRVVDLGAIARHYDAAICMPDGAALSPAQAAIFLTALGYPISKISLDRWRAVRSDGPSYEKHGGRIIYRAKSLREFMATSRVA